VRNYFGFLKTVWPSYKVTLGEQRIRVHGEIGFNAGTYAFSEVRDGDLTVYRTRFSFVYRKRGEHWLILDHHSSAVPVPPG
jgi:hypothetical protein